MYIDSLMDGWIVFGIQYYVLHKRKALLLDINQQNDKSTQKYQREIWTRGHKTVALVGEKCY